MILHMVKCKSCDQPTGEVSTTKEIGVCDECVEGVLSLMREIASILEEEVDGRIFLIEDLEDGELEIDGMWHRIEEDE